MVNGLHNVLCTLLNSSEDVTLDFVRVALSQRTKRKQFSVLCVSAETDQLLARVVSIDKQPMFLVH